MSFLPFTDTGVKQIANNVYSWSTHKILSSIFSLCQGKNQRYELKAMANVTYDAEAEGIIDENVAPNTATVRVSITSCMLSQMFGGIF